eukprot:CAMPEP_0114421408 /NCGR_PEP_ID=MMETSP0103-20121206/5062_1 /TAXON_ID=37642 ORGANISM="Paraphysomonas imperforata, Strain PA2" /NCGR_SAMPLE_ID=MMETSP0103 /ASSEMBLY_ACC=CAM_ASM_000201 /LENGTH=151 /DNA_ID=CAMNT_0001589927 /DNA_START=781 /DNA_END=1236 /DNA_ORIENTATION=-
MRIYFIGRLTVTWILTGEEPGFRQFSTLVWMFLTYWVPTLMPGCLFLYVMQPQSASDVEKDGEGDKHSLTASMSTAPLSDQYYNYDLEDNITSGSDVFSDEEPGDRVGGTEEQVSTGSRNVSMSESDDDGFSERITFYSKDGNDFKMSNFD